jgi:hypothetical protein
MQIESPKEKKLIKLERLADDIRGKAAEANNFIRETQRNGGAAVISAVECGKLLLRAKSACGKGWEKWLLDNCQIDRTTAWRWMKLVSHVKQIEGAASIRQAYLRCGIIDESKTKKERPMGTADVDICANFINQIVRECNKIEALLSGLDLSGVSEDMRRTAREAIAKVKTMEAKL